MFFLCFHFILVLFCLNYTNNSQRKEFFAIVFYFTLYVLPITQTSKGPKKIIRVNENLSCRLFELSGFFFVGGGHQIIKLEYGGGGEGESKIGYVICERFLR